MLLVTATVAGCEASSNSQGAGSFLSSQASEATEAAGMRQQILNGAPDRVSFLTVPDDPTLITRLTAEARSGKGRVDVTGALHGGFASLQSENLLTPVSDVAGDLQHAGIAHELMDLGKLGTKSQYYIPWMQATYVMVANKKALPYLPAGAEVDNLTYPQLLRWAENIKSRTGQAKFGLPASNNGLLKRFLEGYVLPAHSGGLVTTFRNSKSLAAWRYLQKLWKATTPASQTYDFMADPLRSGEVWIAWDHVARIQSALQATPDDFVVFPAPEGPAGRAYMPVVSGLGIPKTAPDPKKAKRLIRYLLSDAAQQKLPAATGFFPVVSDTSTTSLPPGLRLEANAVKRQSSAPGALQSLVPVGLGDAGDAFDKVFTDAFRQIVQNGTDPARVLNGAASDLQKVIDQAHAPCWRPDPPSKGACRIK